MSSTGTKFRALAVTLALGCACAALAQTPVLDESEAVPTAVPALNDAQRQAARAAVEKGDQLVLAGKLDDAIKLLEETDAKQPGDARLAASLSTALESKGDLEKALEWSREAFKRDASEHEGSEWVHSRILVAKIALRTNPDWFSNNRVLDLDFGKGDVPTAPEILPIENGRIKGAKQLIDQARYQIAARTKSQDEPNPFTGDLHASIGDLMISGALTPLDGGKDDPVPEYESALKLGAPNAALIQKRLAKYRADFAALPPRSDSKIEVVESTVSRRFDAAPEQTTSLWIYLGAATGVTLVLVIIGWIIDRRRRKHAEANPPPPLPEFEGDLRLRKP